MSTGREGLPDPTAKLQSVERNARYLATLLQKECPPNWGFALVFFDFTGPEMTWICNAERAGAIKLLEELIERLKEGKAGDIVDADSDLRKRRMAELLKLCTDAERKDLMGDYCHECGRPGPPVTGCPCFTKE